MSDLDEEGASASCEDKGDTDESHNAGGGASPPQAPTHDFWKVQGDYIVRVHVDLRIKMIIPTGAADPSPVDAALFDCARETIAKFQILKTDHTHR